MYADDTAIVAQDINLVRAINRLQGSVDSICCWFNRWRIKINASKTETKIFTLRQIRDPQKIIINNEEIQWNERDSAVKYLGVFLDTRLTWGYHINKKNNQANARLSMLHPILYKKSPLKIDCAAIIYKSIIRPILTYACGVWCNASETHLRKLQTFQNKVVRLATNAEWFVRNTQLHHELDIPLMNDFISKLTKNYLIKLKEHHHTEKLGQRDLHIRLKRKMPQDLHNNDSE